MIMASIKIASLRESIVSFICSTEGCQNTLGASRGSSGRKVTR
jgi:hypothetical protein